MSKYILGGGLVALLAREILGSQWKIIPHGPSRYYSFNPAIADDFITVSAKTDFSLLGTSDIEPYTRAVSFGGELMFGAIKWTYDMYTAKVYEGGYGHLFSVTPPEQAVSIVKAGALYQRLLKKYMGELTESAIKYGNTIKIGNGTIVTSTTTLPYDRIVSTIPLDALYNALGIQHALTSRDAWVYHVSTDQLDFEGADQVLVADETYDFYKVNLISPNQYVFYCLREILTPTAYFGAFTNNRLTVQNPAGTRHMSFIPLDGPVNPKLEAHGISCIGSHAEWDDCVDIGTCIIRLTKLSI